MPEEEEEEEEDMFRATMCPSSGELTVSVRYLVYDTLKQVNSLKLQEVMP